MTPALGHEGAGQAANGILYGQLLQQSQLSAYIDNFRMLAILCLFCLPLLVLFQKTKAKKRRWGHTDAGDLFRGRCGWCGGGRRRDRQQIIDQRAILQCF